MPDASLSSHPDTESAKQCETRTTILEAPSTVQHVPQTKGFRFRMVFVALCVAMFMSALELTSVSTALPTIALDLDAQDFVWVPSAYALASTALLPASGGMAEIFGRRETMLLSLGLFALGSALCGAAQSMNWLIAARTVQGAGGGGILALGSIILSDLIPLKERGMYNALIAFTWSFSAGIGPLVGGALAEAGQWRWLFYLNLPVSGFAAILVIVFLKLRKPPGSFKEKFRRMDWIGNFMITSSSTACVIGLTWGGVRFPWTSPQVLVPLILGLVGIFGFLVYEATIAREPLVPYTIFSNRTSLSGYVQAFIIAVVSITFVYYLPIYYQGCKDASPVRSGVYALGLCLPLGPVLVVSGASVQLTKRYRPQLWIGWVMVLIGAGAMSTVQGMTPVANAIGFTVFQAVGMGMIYPVTYFPILAPVPIAENAHALAFLAFCRSFASVWAVTIGITVLQTQLNQRLPPAFTEQFPAGVAIAYQSIPKIRTLQEPLKTQIQAAFADSVAVVWRVTIGIASVGILASLFMRGLPLHTQVDEKWGLEQDVPGLAHRPTTESEQTEDK